MLICTLVCQVVPMENMNGRELVEAGDLCERRNGLTVYPSDFKYSTRLLAKMFEYLCFCFMAGRGVDLNRNWSVDWGKKEKVRS